MNNKLNITIIGNSVALRVRPVAPYPGNLNYHALLCDPDFLKEKRTRALEVRNLARGGNTIKRAMKDLDCYISHFPDIYILNFGVVDASTREVPRWFFNLYNSNAQNWYNRFSRWIYSVLIKKLRKPLVLLRGKRSWVGSKSYEKLYSMMRDRLLKETNSIIIGLPINPANERVEKALPGSRKNHIIYNKIMERVLDHERCFFMNIQETLTASDYPDGVHYSKAGHEKVAKKIIEVIEDL